MLLTPRHRAICSVAGLLVAASAGCLYVPHRAVHVSGPDVPAAVGSATSSKPLRVDAARRGDVRNRLGEPHDEDQATTWRYYWREGIGTLYTAWKAFNDSPEHPQSRVRVIELSFDHAGTLRHYRIRGAPDDGETYEKMTGAAAAATAATATRPSQP